DTLYVAKGGTIDDDNVMGTIGNNKIVIPKYYFMAVLAKKGSTYKSIAFMLEHQSYGRPYNVQNYAMSVEELEEKTGIDFFHNLPDEIERVVEKQKSIVDWPGL
ncbi:MAG: DNA/RNA non-specific endonuclease, partial [Dysgonamonadaceae bacterium]|nr:DNA/RNA non-specific endonuclease [Dysgonamonadaceae bacterium]